MLSLSEKDHLDLMKSSFNSTNSASRNQRPGGESSLPRVAGFSEDCTLNDMVEQGLAWQVTRSLLTTCMATFPPDCAIVFTQMEIEICF
jgi:hypothetical protein